MLSKWIPWRWFVSRLARSRGFIDPFAVMARMRRFAQPAEVAAPIELLRAGLVFHARGLLNAQAIQHNLDWVWPFWVERQFDPHDPAFVPRAYSLTHVNLTHRNWTAVGLPDRDWMPIVDPRGLVTPLFDGWSIDAWVLADDGEQLLPSRAPTVEQQLLLDDGLACATQVSQGGCALRGRVEVVLEGDRPCCRVHYEGRAERGGFLALSIRPANPEGVSLVHEIRLGPDRTTLHVDGDGTVHLDRPPARVCMSEYHRGDVLAHLGPEWATSSIKCPVGMATAAALYRLEPGRPEEVTCRVPLPSAHKAAFELHDPARWDVLLRGTCRLQVPDEHYRFLFDAAVRSLILHAPGDVYPGPFTYKRFWFRDAAFILNALLSVNLTDHVRRCIEGYPRHQDARGFFRSQEGEWDSNGAALWIIDRYRRLAARPVSDALARAVARGADWICRKRLSDSLSAAHAGLMPAGFSAEHLGLNDFYFWDDFWSAAGLRAAAALHRDRGTADEAPQWERTAGDFLAAIDRAIAKSPAARQGGGVPASPYRRMDAGAIGNLAASYPLRLWDARDARLLKTVEFLMANCWVHGGFFQEMIHSGVNCYLTLQAAQVLLRAGDARHADLTRAVAALASPTGQWPEAVHPLTLGGCMGDGQHIWAAAEWVLMMRSLFVREEDDRLVLGSGLPPAWLKPGATLRLGPTPTPYGPLTVEVTPEADGTRLRWEADWRGTAPQVEAAIPGHVSQLTDGRLGTLTLPRVA